ncbi:tetratricopeptide repeat protein [Clostridium algidicarnis]|uniref:tetratricopeptide repeat protein n=1 Tax=Clostridium algidicarnis TaxID=37659 RepID=UPI001C0D24B5|nr:tetratricopeptide repeat protein [Clostridium algidicarnis]MBU3210649.1 tetratricopeptide repeat protein [Clostridium algidicarnis]
MGYLIILLLLFIICYISIVVYIKSKVKLKSYINTLDDGIGFLNDKDYERALKEFLKAKSILPKSAKAYSLIGKVYVELNEFDEALEYLNTSVNV